jgi:hypothetical protein
MHLMGEMANLVYCNDNQLLKNNHFFALSTTPACNPIQLPSSHTGIANSDASGFYFVPGAPVSNLNLQAPSVGVQVANNLPERSVVCTTLASGPSLPPAAMQGHAMPSFLHTHIGLGPFANLGYQMLFTKTAVSVTHPDGNTILEGWREVDHPCLFPLQATKSSLSATALFEKYEDSSPRRSAADFLNDASLHPNSMPRTAAPMPPPCRLSPTASTTLLHPSQGVSAVDDAGQACFVSYQYGAAQALALAARSSTTPFDLCSLDLPSVGACVVKLTWLEAIKASNCNSFNGLTYTNAARYCPDLDETIIGHLAQQHQVVWSTKLKPPAPNQAPLTPAVAPQSSTCPSN